VAKQQRFIADASHQLKTPLAGLKTQAELALREQDPTKITHALHQINQASGNLSHLISQLLALTKAEPDGASFIPTQTLDLYVLAQAVTADWLTKAFVKNIDLGFDSDAKTALIQGNEVLLRELMNNLIDNAILYTPAGGKITVGLKHESVESANKQTESILFYVQDNGIGLSEEHQARVFERFFRVLGTQQSGCGLGLTIVQEIAERHQATASLTSKGEGQGSLATVRFTV
jgi:two-component system sensor histidine kinase TctE